MRKILFGMLFAAASLQAAPASRKWTVLFYSGSDEPELLKGAIDGLKRVESIRTVGEEVAFVAQIDWPGSDGNYRYELQYAASPTPGKLDSKPIPEGEIQAVEPGFRYGEKDSASPVVLKSFLRWAVRAYPAEHYLLVLAGHSWGQLGIIQDFHVGGKDLEQSTLMKVYELRRVLEETYRENGAFVPRGRFDAIFADACIFGQLEVALELEKVTDYFAASALETPMNSFPYERIFEKFFGAVKSGSPSALEEGFLRPLVEQYILSHGPGGDMAKIEDSVDPVQFMAVRTAGLGEVARHLKETLSQLPTGFAGRWRKGNYPALDAVADSDGNADLASLARVLERIADREGAVKAAASAKELQKALGSSMDPAMKRTELSHAKADGAWLHLDLETVAVSWKLAACVALKSFTMANAQGGEAFLPTFREREKEGGPLEDLPVRSLYCQEAQIESGEKDPKLKVGHPQALKDLFGIEVNWPAGVPAFVSKRKDGGRDLSLWIPKAGNQSLARKVFARVAGSRGLRVDYLRKNPKGFLKRRVSHVRLGGFSESFPAEVLRFPKQGLYAAEGHTNGTHFKQGLSLLLAREFPKDNPYQWGKLPLEQVEKAAYGETSERYETFFAGLSEADRARYVRRGFDFFRLHRFSPLTGWINFLEGKP